MIVVGAGVRLKCPVDGACDETIPPGAHGVVTHVYPGAQAFVVRFVSGEVVVALSEIDTWWPPAR